MEECAGWGLQDGHEWVELEGPLLAGLIGEQPWRDQDWRGKGVVLKEGECCEDPENVELHCVDQSGAGSLDKEWSEALGGQYQEGDYVL